MSIDTYDLNGCMYMSGLFSGYQNMERRQEEEGSHAPQDRI